jgi:NADPH:quinone reductase-like Zn-dependent oxidoreductase
MFSKSKEVGKPVPNDVRGVLVKIIASSVNPADKYDMRGPPFVIRLFGPLFRLSMGVRKPREPGLGTDIAGRVEAVSSKVSQFKPGDEVFGACFAAYAEYGTAKESRIALKPRTCRLRSPLPSRSLDSPPCRLSVTRDTSSLDRKC